MQYYTTIEDRVNQNKWRNSYNKKNKKGKKTKPSPAATQQGEIKTAYAAENKKDSANLQKDIVSDVSVYKSNSGFANNEYTTAAQRKAQSDSLKNLYEEAFYYANKSLQSKNNNQNYSTASKEINTSFANVKDSSANHKTVKGKTNTEPAFEKIENQSINYADYKPKSMFNFMDDIQKSSVTEKKSTDTIKFEVQKYEPEAFKSFADNKPKNQGPSAEMQDTVKTSIDTFAPTFNKTSAFTNNNFFGSYGPNRESIDTVKTAKDTTVYQAYLGPNAETARTGYLDNRGQNAVEKIIEEGLPKTDNSIIVTKDNVYYQSPQKVENTLTEVQNTVKMGISDQKRELEDLQFQQKHIMASGSKEKAAAVEEQIADKKADIEKLQKIDRKLKIGLAFNYQFMENQAEKL